MSLLAKTTTDLKWSAISYFGRQAMRFSTIAILARLLSPADFGLVGMALVVIGFISIFKDLGTSAAIIQRKELSEELRSSVFWINVLFGLIAMIVSVAIAPLIASFYNEVRVVPLLRLLSLTFFISGLSILQQALLQRDQAFDKLAKIEILTTLFGSIVGISSALLNAGAWSLVYQSLTFSIVTTIFLWTASDWKPKLILKWVEVKSISNYGLNLTGFNIFNYFARNMDYILIGKVLGSEALGYYTLAYQLMLYPVQIVSNIVGRVMFPTYSQMQTDTPRFRRIYLRVAGAISLFSFPAMMGIMAISYPFILSVFGSAWIPVAPILMILAPVGLAQSIGTTVGSIYQAKGQTDWMFRWGVLTGVIRTIAFIIGLRWGIIGVAAAYAITTPALSYLGFAIPFRLINLRVIELLRTLWTPITYSLIMFVGVLVLRLFWTWISLNNPWIELISSILMGIIIYVSLLIWRHPPMLQDVASFIPAHRLPWLQRLVALD